MRSHSPSTAFGEPARVTEDVRMASDELLGQGLHDVTEVEGALLLRHAGVEHDLEQEVAQFVTQVVEVAAHDGVDNLVGLLDGVGGDGREALLEVPRTAGSGRAQRRHDVDEPGDVAGRGHGSNLQGRGYGRSLGRRTRDGRAQITLSCRALSRGSSPRNADGRDEARPSTTKAG